MYVQPQCILKMYVCIYDAISLLTSRNVCTAAVMSYGTMLYFIKDLAKTMNCDWEFVHTYTPTKQTLMLRLIYKTGNSPQNFNRLMALRSMYYVWLYYAWLLTDGRILGSIKGELFSTINDSIYKKSRST